MSARPVLLIDDDSEWCARVGRFLEPHGISVVAATTVADALTHVEHSNRPTAVVMDIAARPRQGEAINALRDDGSLRDVPVGWVNIAAALDTLLLMVLSSAATAHQAA